MHSWTDQDTVTLPPKAQCMGCGRGDHVNKHDLCDPCETQFTLEMEDVAKYWETQDIGERELYKGTTRP